MVAVKLIRNKNVLCQNLTATFRSYISPFFISFQLTRNVQWIVVEDSDRYNSELVHTLEHIKVPYVFLQGKLHLSWIDLTSFLLVNFKLVFQVSITT